MGEHNTSIAGDLTTRPAPNPSTPEATKHTPGPWFAKPQIVSVKFAGRPDEWTPFFSVEADWPSPTTSGFGVCLVHQKSNSEISDANARLIAAAPDMLAALKDAQREIEYLCEQSTLRFNIVKTRQAYLNILAAIAKAERGQ